MNISIATLFPDLFSPFLQTSIIKKAAEKGVVSFDVFNYLSLVKPKERIDAPTFGHGAGMLLKPTIVESAVNELENRHGKAFRVFFSPHGVPLTQGLLTSTAERLKDDKHLMLVCGRYEGMDARVEEEYADLIVSIGDYVVMGGEVPAMVFLEGLLRHVPGVVGRIESVEHDSFTGPFVDHPEFTEPVVWHGKEVPAVIRSGNHGAIRAWRDKQAAQRTVLHHFDWLRTSPMTTEQRDLSFSCIPPHYAVLMHADVMVKDKGELRPGTTSITSFDIHDIARSAKTYGIKEYFLVTTLMDQRKIAETILGFWKQESGAEYNIDRYRSIESVSMQQSLDDCIARIREREGKEPILIATAARDLEHSRLITYRDQGKVWAEQRPVLFVFGTGSGLSPKVLDRADYLLVPVKGFVDFNHLSVRSAAAIVFDRWLGRADSGT